MDRNEILKRFARAIRGWMEHLPARSGEIRERVCARLKLLPDEFEKWVWPDGRKEEIENRKVENRKENNPELAALPPSAGEDGDGGSGGQNGGASVAAPDERRRRSLKWLKRRYGKLFNAAKEAQGTQRDRLLERLFAELAANVSAVSVVTLDRIRNEICDKADGLNVSRKAYDAAIRAAKMEVELSGEGEAREGEDGDWLRLAQQYKDEAWAGGTDKPPRAIVRWQSEWYEWRERYGCYKRVSKEMMLASVVQWLAAKNLVVTTAMAANFLQSLTALCVIDDAIAPPCWLELPEGANPTGMYWALRNGILDLDSVNFEMGDSVTHAPLIGHTPKWFSVNVLPYDFDPGADDKRPLLDAAVATWQPAGERDPEGLGQRLLQDWAGYVFWAGQPLQCFLLNIGEGSDGKSQYMQIVEALAGLDNAEAVDLDGFDPKNQFGMWPLLGKMLNTVFDATYVERVTTGRLKQVTAGDRVTVARKNLPSITTVLGCKIQISCNELPGFSDRSDATWRRMMILEWLPIPASMEVVDFAKKVIASEMPGVFLWALRGYKRVRACKFKRIGLVADNVKRAKEQIQHEFGFFEERLSVVEQKGANGEWVENNRVYLGDLMSAYKDYCREHNVKASCYPEAMGRSLRKWVKDELRKAEWPETAMGEFVKKTGFLGRDGAGLRREFYRGLKLAEDWREAKLPKVR